MDLSISQIEFIKKEIRRRGIKMKSLQQDLLDHICCLIEEQTKNGTSFERAYENAIKQFGENGLEKVQNETNISLIKNQLVMTAQRIFQGFMPFIILGFIWLIILLPVNQSGVFLSVGLLFMFVLFTIGWIKGFPYWAFPVSCFVVLISVYAMSVSSPGLTGSRELLGFKALIPLVISIFIAIAFTRSTWPLKQLVLRIKNDWTLLVFAFYGFLPVMLMFLFDEVNWRYELPFALGLILLVLVGAYIYLKSSKKLIKILSLAIAAVLSVTIAIIASLYYWDNIFQM